LKIAMLSYPSAFDAPVMKVPVGIVPQRLVRKNENDGAIPDGKKIEDMFIRF